MKHTSSSPAPFVAACLSYVKVDEWCSVSASSHPVRHCASRWVICSEAPSTVFGNSSESDQPSPTENNRRIQHPQQPIINMEIDICWLLLHCHQPEPVIEELLALRWNAPIRVICRLPWDGGCITSQITLMFLSPSVSQSVIACTAINTNTPTTYIKLFNR